MLKITFFLTLALSLNAFATPKLSWTLKEGIQNPESVCYHEASKTFFVSNVAGQGTAKDGNGYIAQVGLDGKMLNAGFTKGLNAPKGMRIFKDTLWVSDIDELIAIDLPSGNIKMRLKEPTAKFLNDVAVDKNGRVFVSDTLTSKIFVCDNNKLSVFMEGADLESPNGLLVVGKELIVAAWGLTTDFSTKVPGRLYALNLTNKKKRLITKKPFANLDGLEQDGKGGYYTSDWMNGKLYHIGSSGKTDEILAFAQGAADLAYLPAKKLLVIPQMNESKVIAYELK